MACFYIDTIIWECLRFWKSIEMGYKKVAYLAYSISLFRLFCLCNSNVSYGKSFVQLQGMKKLKIIRVKTAANDYHTCANNANKYYEANILNLDRIAIPMKCLH